MYPKDSILYGMELLLLDILASLRNASASGNLNKTARAKLLAEAMRRHDHTCPTGRWSKKQLLPFYFKTKSHNPDQWKTWGVDEPLERELILTLQMKPRRTSSGVATITVITKPWKCGNNCLYCPNDIRMPKSYLTNEPACQRAERNCFDPYLQVASRLRALSDMGHPTDKIELIVLGGTWNDYPESYQLWFATELFRALNDGTEEQEYAQKRRDWYQSLGIPCEDEFLHQATAEIQAAINEGDLSYNQAWTRLYGESLAWQQASKHQVNTIADLEYQHIRNESANHRVVGLVVETRPQSINPKNLTLLRRMGCTKIQMGIQSLNPQVLEANQRPTNPKAIKDAFSLLRLFGFKIHAHFMVNLLGADCASDKEDYRIFVTDESYLPDEVKLYPCALVEGTGLCKHYSEGTWRPYTEEELLDILINDVMTTPPYTRISRMIRDISAGDILAGNKKTNLRQLVEERISTGGLTQKVSEIRFRELDSVDTDGNNLRLDIVKYHTSSTIEFFMQWIVPNAGTIAGFLRLSLPSNTALETFDSLPIKPNEAMIREVHIYGKAAKLHHSEGGAQHRGLGKRLIDSACEIARQNGYEKINVISAVGTREYYRRQGFTDNGLYQQREL